jgi:hypothetical protein
VSDRQPEQRAEGIDVQQQQQVAGHGKGDRDDRGDHNQHPWREAR